MFEFRVQLFPVQRPKGLLGSLKSILSRLRKPKRGDILDLKIGSPTEYSYNCVDVYYRDAKIGEIRKKGIDEMIEKEDRYSLLRRGLGSKASPLTSCRF
jgi:hypothetical protein